MQLKPAAAARPLRFNVIINKLYETLHRLKLINYEPASVEVQSMGQSLIVKNIEPSTVEVIVWDTAESKIMYKQILLRDQHVQMNLRTDNLMVTARQV